MPQSTGPQSSELSTSLSLGAFLVAIKQAITQALNAIQGNKHWLSVKPFIDLYPILRQDLNLNISTGVQLL